MSIGISSVGATTSLANVASVSRTPSSLSSNSAEGAQSRAKDRAEISGPAALLGKPKSLQASDPTKLKEVMTQIATSLSEKAEASTDPGEKKMLTELASKFETAAETGDLSGLEPPKGGSGPHGPHGPPPSGGGKTEETKATDPADTNEDGTVSHEEKAAYEAKQAASGAVSYAKQAAADAHEKMESVLSSIDSIVGAAMR